MTDEAIADSMTVTPLAIVPAWKLIGWDDGANRIVGGRTLYESCDGNATNRNVLLQRLDCSGYWPRSVRRYVDAFTMIEVLEDVNGRLSDLISVTP